MASKFRSVVKVIANEIDKHKANTLNNAMTAIGNATEKAQEKLNTAQNLVTSKYDILAKQINSETTIFQDLNNTTKLQPVSPLPKTIVKWWQWYQQLTGLDTVEVYRQQVNLAQEKLFKCQDSRRSLNQEATMLNDKLKEIYGELLQTKRDDPRYVQLTIIENKSLQDLARIGNQLNLLEKEERDHFTMLATAIKEYHDSQAMNAQKYKYLSILTSALLAVASLTGSMIYNNKRILDVRNVIAQAQEQNKTALATGFQSLEENFITKISEILVKLEEKTDNPVPVPPQTPIATNKNQNPIEVMSYKLGVDKTYVAIGIGIFAIYFLKAVFG